MATDAHPTELYICLHILRSGHGMSKETGMGEDKHQSPSKKAKVEDAQAWISMPVPVEAHDDLALGEQQQVVGEAVAGGGCVYIRTGE